MILKVMGSKGRANYFSAEEFTTQKVSLQGLYDQGFKSDYDKSKIGYYNDRANVMITKIQELTDMNDQIIDFMIDCEYEDVDLLLCVYPRSRGKEHNIIATNQNTFLMSDEGKTIERLI